MSPEPTSSNYPAALDDNTSLAGNVVNMKSFVLATTVDDIVTTITMTATITGINTPCYLLLDTEVIYAPSKSGADFTSCVRGADGTTAAPHTSGINVDAVYAANLFNQLKRAIVAIETELGIAPSGAAIDVVTRFNSLDTSISGINTTIATDESRLAHNYLINGGFDFAQRQAPTALTTLTIDKCSADRWRISRENADLQYQRSDGLAETGLTSQYFGTFKKITNTGKLVLYQIIEGTNSVALRGKTIIFQCQMKASSAKTIRMAVLELQNAGTIDTIPATFIAAYGANTTDPTFGANVAIITAAQSKSVTTAMQTFSVSVTVPSNSKNIICAVWSDSQFAANDTLSLAEAGLYVGSVAQVWRPRLVQQEYALCRRYYFKTFGIDVAPAQNAGVTGCFRFIAGKAGALTEFATLHYPVLLRTASPTITTYNPSATNALVRDTTAGVDCSGVTVGAVSNERMIGISTTGNASTAVGNILDVHITADAEL